MRPAVIWFTGLSGAGKTTLAHAVLRALERRAGRAEHLDGDAIRDLFPSTGFSPRERDEHVRRVGYVASLLERHGVSVVVSLISPYQASREFARGLCANFVEIHLSTPLEECERRDVKGLYRRAREGQLRDFTGVSAPYEAPARPEIELDTSGLTPEQAAGHVLSALERYL